MPKRPRVVALDVVETVFALESLSSRIRSAGLPEEVLKLFFAQMLRDAFALEASGVYKPFREVAAGSLAVVMANHGASASQDTIGGVLAGFAELAPHPDVEPALDRLRASGMRVIALTNGKAPGPAIPARNGATRRPGRNHARCGIRPALDARLTFPP